MSISQIFPDTSPVISPTDVYKRQEILSYLEGAKKVVLVGCGECATVCKTGGEEELENMKAFLASHGIEVVGSIYPQSACNKLLMKKELKALKDVLPECDAVVSLSCCLLYTSRCV